MATVGGSGATGAFARKCCAVRGVAAAALLTAAVPQASSGAHVWGLWGAVENEERPGGRPNETPPGAVGSMRHIRRVSVRLLGAALGQTRWGGLLSSRPPTVQPDQPAIVIPYLTTDARNQAEREFRTCASAHADPAPRCGAMRRWRRRLTSDGRVGTRQRQRRRPCPTATLFALPMARPAT